MDQSIPLHVVDQIENNGRTADTISGQIFIAACLVLVGKCSTNRLTVREERCLTLLPIGVCSQEVCGC